MNANVERVRCADCWNAVRMSRVTGTPWPCPRHGVEWDATPRQEPESLPRPRVVTVDPLPVSDPPRRFDPARHDWDARADLEVLAKWASHFYGRGVALATPVQTSAMGRTSPTDGARAHEREMAAAIHARFEALRAGEGRLHYAVLEFAYLRKGPEERTRWDGFLAELAWQFATPKQRKAWQSQRRSVAAGARTAKGQRLHDEAVAAYRRGPVR